MPPTDKDFPLCETLLTFAFVRNICFCALRVTVNYLEFSLLSAFHFYSHLILLLTVLSCSLYTNDPSHLVSVSHETDETVFPDNFLRPPDLRQLALWYLPGLKQTVSPQAVSPFDSHTGE